jgi:hypothetical protein
MPPGPACTILPLARGVYTSHTLADATANIIPRQRFNKGADMGFTLPPLPSDQTPMGKNTSPFWPLAIGLGAAAAVASFFIGANSRGWFDLDAGLLAAALNPLVWLAGYAFTRVNRFICPHCGTLWWRYDSFTKVAAGNPCQCTCGNYFLKPPAT